MRHLSITTKGQATEPVTFDLNGDKFVCAPHVAGSVVLDFFTALLTQSDPVQADAVGSLLNAALTRTCMVCNGTKKDGKEVCSACAGTGEDRTELIRFRAYADDPANEVGLQAFVAIAGHLAAEYGKVPTQPASASSPGPDSTTDTSTVEGSSEDSP